MALYSAAELPRVPFLYGRRTQEVLRKKVAIMLAAVMMLGVMSVSPAMAHFQIGHVNMGHQDDDNLDHDQGGGTTI
jgi:hypothetical protein